MATLDLRPLSLGELLDRTFFLYRRHFFLFTGIAAIPYSLLLVLNLVNILFSPRRGFLQSPPVVTHLQSAGWPSTAIGIGSLAGVAALAVFAFSLGATVFAVSEIYLGRSTSIVESLRRARGRFLTIIGVIILAVLIFAGGLILLIVPGFYFMCRLSVAIAAAVLERIGPFDAVGRSFQLTKDFAGRAFFIYLVTIALAIATVGILQFPFGILMAVYARQPSLLTIFLVLMQVGSFLGSVLVAPVSTIGFALFYYDLRVRKEAFDLQMMMQSISGGPTSAAISGSVPSAIGPDAS